MAFSQNTAQHIAQLAKLNLTPKQLSVFSGQLKSVLEHFSILGELNTENVHATNQVTGLYNVFRKDKIVLYPADKKAKLFREAPRTKDGFIVVPHTIKRYK